MRLWKIEGITRCGHYFRLHKRAEDYFAAKAYGEKFGRVHTICLID